jgi:hypothetical protein
MSEIRRSDYGAVPTVWGDERGDMISVPVHADEVQAGQLLVFTNDHGNAYKVNSIDWVPMPEGSPLIRYNCTGGATAGSYEDSVVHILTEPGTDPDSHLPLPEIADTQIRDSDTWRQLSFYFHGRVNDSGSMSFAIWHRDAQTASLYSAEGSVLDKKDWTDSTPTIEHVIDKVRASWGTVSTVLYSDRQYPSD